MWSRSILAGAHREHLLTFVKLGLRWSLFNLLLPLLTVGSSSWTYAKVEKYSKHELPRLNFGSLADFGEWGMQLDKSINVLALLTHFMHPIVHLDSKIFFPNRSVIRPWSLVVVWRLSWCHWSIIMNFVNILIVVNPCRIICLSEQPLVVLIVLTWDHKAHVSAINGLTSTLTPAWLLLNWLWTLGSLVLVSTGSVLSSWG